jgi:hypothetical protein
MEPKHVVEEEQEINVAYRWTHLILINVNLVQQDATIQDSIGLITSFYSVCYYYYCTHFFACGKLVGEKVTEWRD